MLAQNYIAHAKKYRRSLGEDELSHAVLQRAVDQVNITAKNCTTIFRSFWYYQWAHSADKLAEHASNIKHSEIQMDGTYKALAQVKSTFDWRTVMHEAYRNAQNGAQMHPGALSSEHGRRGLSTMSVSQFVLSDEFELPHMVIPINGLLHSRRYSCLT